MVLRSVPAFGFPVNDKRQLPWCRERLLPLGPTAQGRRGNIQEICN